MTSLGSKEFTLTASCPGATGIVAAVSGYLAAQGCYIVEMAEFDDVQSGRFFLRSVFRERPDDPPGPEVLRDEFADHLRQGFRLVGIAGKDLAPSRKTAAIEHQRQRDQRTV